MAADKKTREAAFKEIFGRYSRKIYVFCRKFTGNDTISEDITQDVFLSLIRYLDSGNRVDNLQGLLFRTAKNLCINRLKSSPKLEVFLEDSIPALPETSYESKELAFMIETALELLPDEHREAFCLQMYCGLSYSEIAEINDVPLTTVRNWIVRAKLKMRKILAPYFEETR